MNKHFLKGLCVITALLCGTAYASKSAGNMVVFGDSLSDNGNNTWIFATGAPITSLDESANKSIWVDFLSKKLFNKPVYSVREAREEGFPIYSSNVNYAYASADTSGDFLAADWPVNTPIPSVNPSCHEAGLIKNQGGQIASACVPGLLKQVDAYLKDVSNKANPNTVFFIWIGANDIFYKLPKGQDPKQIITAAVNNIATATNKLVAAGISPKNIYVLNLPDLSKTPYAIKHALQLTEISMAFNQALESMLTTDQGNKGALLEASHIISIYDFLNEVVASPNQYNLSDVQSSCVENLKTPLCKGYLFYDAKHPTASVSPYLADYVLSKL